MPNLFLSFSFWIILTVLSSMALAAENTEITPDDYELMQTAYDSCTKSSYNDRYHCDCAAVMLMDTVQTTREHLRRSGLEDDQITARLYARMDDLRSESYRNCINRDNVAVDSYGQCLEWALKTRDDYREFCGCYALRYAETVDQEGLTYFSDPAATMAQAMIYCNRELKPR